jgi:phosphinothricin acetyltransferase
MLPRKVERGDAFQEVFQTQPIPGFATRFEDWDAPDFDPARRIAFTSAAFPVESDPIQTICMLFLNMAEGYPFLVARDGEGRVLGFALLRPHNPMPAFSRTADITYFIAPGHTGQGIGRAMQVRLLNEAREKGITSIMASISSLNSKSLNFHKKQGFQECGRFQKVGRKWGQDFDEIWMQKMI